MTGIRKLAAALAAATLSLLAHAAHAQPWPQRPVTIVVPYSPGTGADLLARALAPRLAERWKVPVVTENRPGASGNIGAEAVAKAAPDGHTLLFAATSFATNPAVSRNLPFDPATSFAPLTLLATSALALVVSPELPVRSFDELAALARKEPGKLNYSSPGTGTSQHFAMELLKLDGKMDLVHVPYKGQGGGLADLVGGHVPVAIVALQTAAPQVRAGKIRLLAVLGPMRAATFPDVPTMKEQGYPDLVIETWYAAFAPGGTPQGTVVRLNADLNEALADPSIRESLQKQGLTPGGGTSEALRAHVAAELARWARVAASAKMRAE